MKQRGRRKGSDGEKSRKRLLDIAAEEFAQYGFHATKISTIVKRADVTQPTFYLYFESKEAIYQELIDLFKKQLSTLTMESRLDAGIQTEELQQRIEEKIETVFQLFLDNEHIARIGFIASEDAIHIQQRMAEEIQHNLQLEVQEGYFRTDMDLPTVAMAIVGVIEHLTLTRLWTGDHTPQALATEVTQLFLDGLRKR